MSDTQPTIFADMPRPRGHQVVRADSTEAAREAATRMAADDKLTECFRRVLRWIWRWPDCTYRELAAKVRLTGAACEEQEPARRYKLLRDSGLISETDRRRCSIGGTNCSTYRITDHGRQYLRDIDGGQS